MTTTITTANGNTAAIKIKIDNAAPEVSPIVPARIRHIDNGTRAECDRNGRAALLYDIASEYTRRLNRSINDTPAYRVGLPEWSDEAGDYIAHAGYDGIFAAMHNVDVDMFDGGELGGSCCYIFRLDECDNLEITDGYDLTASAYAAKAIKAAEERKPAKQREEEAAADDEAVRHGADRYQLFDGAGNRIGGAYDLRAAWIIAKAHTVQYTDEQGKTRRRTPIIYRVNQCNITPGGEDHDRAYTLKPHAKPLEFAPDVAQEYKMYLLRRR